VNGGRLTVTDLAAKLSVAKRCVPKHSTGDDSTCSFFRALNRKTSCKGKKCAVEE
jgi:hypothetical protein